MHGSVVNRIMENSRYPEIVVGMGATVCMYSDRQPYTVVAVRYDRAGKVQEIDLRGDHVSANKKVWPAQDYDITPASTEICSEPSPDRIHFNEDAHTPVQTWRMDKNGRLRKTYISRETRRRVMAPKGSDGLSLGHRDYYQSPEF